MDNIPYMPNMYPLEGIPDTYSEGPKKQTNKQLYYCGGKSVSQTVVPSVCTNADLSLKLGYGAMGKWLRERHRH